jgi:hypothetical protein
MQLEPFSNLSHMIRWARAYHELTPRQHKVLRINNWIHRIMSFCEDFDDEKLDLRNEKQS